MLRPVSGSGDGSFLLFKIYKNDKYGTFFDGNFNQYAL